MKVIKKHTGAIHIKNRLSLLQRKISNVLLFYAYNNLLEKDSHEIEIKRLASDVGFNSNDIELVKNSLRKLVTTKIEWNILDERNKEEWGVCSSLSEAIIKDGICRYAYPPVLRERLFHPEYYAKINLQIQRTISGNYALALYENLVRYKNVGTTDWIELQKFRELMGADKVKSYQQFKDFNKYVIKPAINEVNRVTDILVDVKTRRIGRQIKFLKFSIQKREELPPPIPFDDDDKLYLQLTKRLAKLGFKPKKSDEILNQYEYDYIIKHLEYIESKVQNGEIKKSASGFLISALKDDYNIPSSKKKKNIKKEKKVNIDISPGTKVIYYDQELSLSGEKGAEYIEFHGGKKMDREMIIDLLREGRIMSLVNTSDYSPPP